MMKTGIQIFTFSISVFLFTGCTDSENKVNERLKEDAIKMVEKQQRMEEEENLAREIYQNCYCNDEKTALTYFCNETVTEKYQIYLHELRNLNPGYIFSILCDSNSISSIHFFEQQVSSSSNDPYREYFTDYKVCPIHNIYKPDTHFVHKYYNAMIEMQLSDELKAQLHHYLHEVAWKTEKIDYQNLDGEYWSIQGKNGKQKLKIYRTGYEDSIFYSAVHILLDQLPYSIYDRGGPVYTRYSNYFKNHPRKNQPSIMEALYQDSIFKKKR